MNIVVQKYGGSSVENKEKLENICTKIISYVNRGINIVVVVSAQGKTTNRLIDKAHDYSNNPNKRDLDLLLCSGEIQTVALLSMMLNEKGYLSIGLTRSTSRYCVRFYIWQCYNKINIYRKHFKTFK
ncbi:MAG: hypothetical protein RSB76_01000 [Clostridia bacterium]